MQFHTKKGTLQDELSRLQSIVERKNTIPILDNVKIETLGGKRLRLSATNLETTIMTEMMADQVDVPGAMCVPARRFFEVVRLLPQDKIATITRADNDWAQVVVGGTRFKMPSADPTNFPELPKLDGLKWLEVPGKQLKGLFAGVDSSIAPEEDVRFLLKGVKIEMDGTELKMCTTDGHRLSLATATLSKALSLAPEAAAPGELGALKLDDEEEPQAPALQLDMLLPQKGLQDLSKILADHVGDVGVAATDNNVYFRAGSRLLVSRKLVGAFPNYKGIFAAITCEHTSTFKAAELAQAIKRVALAADPHSQQITFSFEEGRLFISAKTAEAGEANDVLDTNFNGGSLKVNLSARYLLDFLEPIGTGVIKFDAQTALDPMRCSGEKEGIKYEYIMMPMDVPE